MRVNPLLFAVLLVLVGVSSDGLEVPDSAVEIATPDNATVIDRTNDSTAAPAKSPRATSAGFLLLGLRIVPILAVLLFAVSWRRWRGQRAGAHKRKNIPRA